MAFVDDERDDPAADRELEPDVGEEEERHEVHGADAEDLLVLVEAPGRVLRPLVRGLADLLQAICQRVVVRSASVQLRLRL